MLHSTGELPAERTLKRYSKDKYTRRQCHTVAALMIDVTCCLAAAMLVWIYAALRAKHAA